MVFVLQEIELIKTRDGAVFFVTKQTKKEVIILTFST
jgi:hypothetical protein